MREKSLGRAANEYFSLESSGNYGNSQCNAPFVDSKKCPIRVYTTGVHIITPTYRRTRSKTFSSLYLHCILVRRRFSSCSSSVSAINALGERKESNKN